MQGRREGSNAAVTDVLSAGEKSTLRNWSLSKAFSLAEKDDRTRGHQRSGPEPAYPGCEFVGRSSASTSRPMRATMSGTASTSG
jgi:hypothetical protein